MTLPNDQASIDFREFLGQRNCSQSSNPSPKP